MANHSDFKSGTFTSWDQTKLFFRILIKPSAVATLVIVHGHGEHTGRYEKFAQFLKDLPISIACFDLRGCGQSGGRDVYVDSIQDYVRDLEAFFNFIRDEMQCPQKYVLLGHSLGGLISLKWALSRSSTEINQLILSSPCLGLTIPSFLVKLNKVINSVCPTFLYRNPVLPQYLTHSHEEKKKYFADPLIRRKITARLVSEMVLAGDLIRNSKTIELDIPVTVLMGDQEKIVDPVAIEQFYEKLKAPSKSIQLFTNFYHEIFNELGQDKAFRALIDAIKKILS